jgi:hypothetical protein
MPRAFETAGAGDALPPVAQLICGNSRDVLMA